jgi:hypothetical protein
MEKISAVARLLAILLAIASAFFTSSLTVPLLLILGGIAAIGNTPDRNAKNYLMAIVLVLGAPMLDAMPLTGPYLATVFTSLGAAFVGASIVAITITLEERIRRDWLKK